MITRAKELRREATKQENHLWYDFLCKYPVRFQRQKTIQSFIADFYCHAAKLVIELDGKQHETAQGTAYDKERSEILQKYGLQVVRFTNHEVETDFFRVCKDSDQIVAQRVAEVGQE